MMRVGKAQKKTLLVCSALLCAAFSGSAFAQAYYNPGYSAANNQYPAQQQQQGAVYNPYAYPAAGNPYANQQQAVPYGLYNTVPQPGTMPPGAQQNNRNTAGPAWSNLQQQQRLAPAEPADLGDASDPNSQAYKVRKLGNEAVKQRAEMSTWDQKSAAISAADDAADEAPPTDVRVLQQINQTNANTVDAVSDDPVNAEVAFDMRKDAQKEAALSYGARGGLAKRNYEIVESMEGYGAALDKVFDFRQLLIKAPSGMLIEPPIVKEADKALVIDASGDEAAVADRVFDINKKAKIVSAPRNWRQYLQQSWSKVPPPPRVLWPKTPQEQANWNSWVEQGWQAGIDQADQIFETKVNQLVADYNGMVRYRMLLAQNMITAPYAMHEDRGVTGDENQMRVGDRAIRITGPSQFLTKANTWKPADQ